MEEFEDLEAWRKAKQLSLAVYALFAPELETDLRRPLQSAARKAMNKIAEGFEHKSSRDLAQHLYQAKAAVVKTRSLGRLAQELQLISDAQAEKLYQSCRETSAAIVSLLQATRSFYFVP